jgi:hypothetical protein
MIQRHALEHKPILCTSLRNLTIRVFYLKIIMCVAYNQHCDVDKVILQSLQKKRVIGRYVLVLCRPDFNAPLCLKLV